MIWVKYSGNIYWSYIVKGKSREMKSARLQGIIQAIR